MTEIKWTKFKDALPEDEYFFITCGNKVWVNHPWNYFLVNGYQYYYPDGAWSPIELPEAPKKQLHSCVGKGGTFCSEIEDLKGAKSLLFNLPSDEITSRLLSVDTCPFCGYEVRE